MSLSAGERRELERFRAKRKSDAKLSWAVTKGTILAFVFAWIPNAFMLDTLVWNRIQMFGIFGCFIVGILSSYYGPFKKKKEEKRTSEERRNITVKELKDWLRDKTDEWLIKIVPDIKYIEAYNPVLTFNPNEAFLEGINTEPLLKKGVKNE